MRREGPTCRVSRIAFDVVKFSGHENIRAEHETTLEITREDYLTPRGDCIVGVKASKALTHLNPGLKAILRKDSGRLIVVLISNEGSVEIIKCSGSRDLSLSDEVRMIVRKSKFTSGNTLCINSDKSATDLSREFVESVRRTGGLGVLIGYLLECSE